MKLFLRMRSAVALLLSISFLAAQSLGQQPAPKPAVKSATQPQQVETNVSFETLVAADSYKVYGEVRSIGQQVRAGGLIELLEPARMMLGAPKDFKTLVDFLTTNADALLGARLLLATAPARSGIPDSFFALELTSPDEAMKFEPKLRTFLPTVLPSPEPPTVLVTETNTSKEANSAKTLPKPQVKNEARAKKESQAPPFILKRSGNLLLMSAAAFTFKSLLPDGSKPLSEDASFHQVRDRFANDAVFIYYNVALQNQVAAQQEKEAAQNRDSTPSNTIVAVEMPGAQTTGKIVSSVPESSPAPTPLPQAAKEEDEEAATVEVQPSEPADEAMTGAELSRETAPNNNATLIAQSQSKQEDEQEAAAREAQDKVFSALMGGLFNGQPKWPDAVGIGAALNGDDLVVRALLVSTNGERLIFIPFIPALIYGPQQTPESPSVLPAETELFITASLDLPQIYDAAMGFRRDEDGDPARSREERIKASAIAMQVALFEKSHGFKIKEEFLSSIGNEIAVAVPLEWFSALTIGNRTTKKDEPAKPGIAILISLKDKEAFRALLPKVLDAFGIKQLADVAQTQKIEDAEIVNYGVVTVAYVNNFLVVAPDPATIRRVVEAYTKHETLSSNSAYKLATSWQPRQTLGQIYVSKTLMEGYKEALNNPIILSDEETHQFLSHFNFESEPITYSLSDDGLGQLHELHIPRNFILLAVAQASLSTKPAIANQAGAVMALRFIAAAESNYKEEKGKGNFATLGDLIKEGSVPKQMLENRSYRFEVTITGDKFTANALPINYGKEGYLSFFLDENGVVHAGDHRGQPATTDDPVVK